MQTSTAGYKTAQASAAPKPTHVVTADWNRDDDPASVHVNAIDVDRTITSDLPSEVTLITGFGTAEAVIELVGDPLDNTAHPAALYSPYRVDAVLAEVDVEGVPLRVRLGYEVSGSSEDFLVLDGTVREIAFSADAGDVTASLTALDVSREQLDVPAVFPPAVGNDYALGFQPGLNSQWIVDQCLRGAGIYSSPPVRAQCVVSATMHGSAWPDVGAFAQAKPEAFPRPASAPMAFAPARFALGLQSVYDAAFPDLAGYVTYFTANDLDLDSGALRLECWIGLDLARATSQVNYNLKVGAGNGVRNVQVGHNNANYYLEVIRNADFFTSVIVTGPAITHADGVMHPLVVLVTFTPTTITVTWRIDGVTTGPTSYANVATGTPVQGLWAVHVSTRDMFEALQVTTESSLLPLNESFAPTAVLEPGLNELLATPPIGTDATARSVIGEVAKAEGGVFLLDELGIYRFWSRDHWTTAAAATIVQRTLTADGGGITRVSVTRQADRVRNVVRVPYTPHVLSDTQLVWNLDEYVYLLPGQTMTREIALASSVIITDRVGGYLPTPPTASGYRVAHKADGSSGSAGLTASMGIFYSATGFRVEVTNTSTSPLWLVTPNNGAHPASSVGKPAVQVWGYAIQASTPVVAERSRQASIDAFGRELPITIESSAWMQHETPALALAADILHDTAWPRPQIPPVQIVADPTLQLGDRVQLVDSSGVTGLDEPFWIVGSRISYAGGQDLEAIQELTLRPVSPPRGWLIGVPGRSEIGVTTRV